LTPPPPIVVLVERYQCPRCRAFLVAVSSPRKVRYLKCKDKRCRYWTKKPRKVIIVDVPGRPPAG
jgi:hypothetical protein